MGSHVDYTAPSFIVSNIDSNNESADDDEFEEENNINYVEEDTSEISLSNDMDTSMMDSDYEDHNPDLTSADEVLVTYEENSPEIDTTEGNVSTDSEGENNETITQVTKKIKLDIDEEVINEADSTDDVADKCPICLEAWNSSGKHRLCSLRCGHLFGYNCIKLWLNSDNSGTKNCPQCHAKASVRHIRFLYANKLTSSDNSEIERMKEELKQVRLRESKVLKALIKEKQKTRKYKQMYKARTLALTADSDFCFSD